MSNLTSASGEASISSDTMVLAAVQAPSNPDAEVIALSPKTLMTTNRFICEICNKGFQRDQNLQLHRRGHNLPWKLKQRSSKEIRKRVYICPEESCVHHDPARALGDLTGVKKHFCRKHGEKKWKCDKCSKRYAVQSDWKAHSKTCGTREYRCDCGTLFSRRDSFITHRAFCDALAEESARMSAGITVAGVHVPESNPLAGLPGAGLATGHMSVLRGASASGSVSSSPSPQFSFAMRPSARASDSNLSLMNSSRWEQNQGGAGSRPRLPLWLGNNSELLGPPNSQQLHMTGGHQFGSMDVNPFTQSPKSMQSMLGLSDYDDSQGVKGANLSAILPNPGSLYSNMLTNTTDHFGVANWADRTGSTHPHPAARLSLSTSAANLTTSTSNNIHTENTSNLYSSNNESIPHQQHQNPYMSATALLQKAAQMGATAGNPPMFAAFGMAGSDTGANHVGLGLSWQDSVNQDRLATMVSGLESHHHGSNPFRPMDSMNAPHSMNFRPSEQAGLHDLMNSLSAGGAAAGFFGNSLNGIQFGADSSYGRIMNSSDINQPSVRHSPMCVGGTQNQQQMMQRRMSTSNNNLLGLGNLKDGGDGLTRDFLGVGGPAEELGRTLNIASLSSDLASYHNRDSSHSHSQSVGTANTGLSPPKSWDAS
ncbi:hypothetical protein KI387_043275 [Taxus chinensis]|uniref:C2H2-type domain-containing protein n=2 Tax=Taxus chinensis TaxID=29808 RepID=A0AA38F7D0_TAXCH|nr:hypothetical protein KI387_043275 [Taxus chinensis]